MNTKVAVTGATGFLGKKVVYALKRLNFCPIAFGRNRSLGSTFIEDDIPFISVDLTDREEVVKLFEGVDYVIHCAGLSSVWGAKSDFIQTNVVAVENIVEACQAHAIKRLVHVSTPSLYFDYKDKFDLNESAPLPRKFVNHYASSKKMGENIIEKAYVDGLQTVVLRPRGIFGPGDTSIFPRILRAMEKGSLPLINGGQALMDITYVDNVVDAIILAMQVQNVDGYSYNITNDDPRTFIELLELLSDKLHMPLKTKNVSFNSAYYSAKVMEGIYSILCVKREPPITCYGVGLVSKSMTFDIAKAKNELGYHPKVSIDDGLDRFADWWRTQ